MNTIKHRLTSLLKWSEKYTQTDMTYIATGGFWTTLSYFIQVGIGVISTVALANYLPKENLGTYQFILAAAGVVGAFTLTGLGTSIARSVAQGKDGVLRSGVRTKLKWSIGVLAASLTGAAYYAVNGNADLAVAFLIVGVCTAITESFVLYENYLIGKKAFRDGVLLGAWRKPLPLIALLSALPFTTHAPTLVGVYLGTTTLSTLLVYSRVLKKYRPPIQDDIETVNYGKQLSIMRGLHQIATHADKVLLWYILGPVAVATFSIAQLATRYSGGLAGTISNVALPKVATRDLPILQATLPRKIGIFTLVMVPPMLLYIALVPFLFTLLFPEYPDSIPLAQVLGILFLFIPTGVLNQVLTAHKQTRALYLLSTVMPASKLLLMAFGISLFGIWGAVYALIAGYLLTTLYIWFLFMTARPAQQGTFQQ